MQEFDRLDVIEVQIRHWFTTSEERNHDEISNIIEQAETVASEYNPRSQYLLGEAYCLAGKLTQSAIALEKAVMLNPLNSDYVGSYALVQWQLGKPEVAEQYLEICRSLNPKNGQFDFHLGTLAYNKYNRKRALDMYRSASRKLQGSDQSEYQRDKRRADEAIERLTRKPNFNLGRGGIIMG